MKRNSAARHPLWVLKLGGSLALSPVLQHWLRVAAELDGQVMIVPGGGPYADAVRLAQDACQFDDAAAHAMALVAMEQFGRQICAMQPALVPAANPDAIVGAMADGRTPVWMAQAMVLADPGVAQDWTVTSDSLAAWLATKLQAHGLVLVKSVPTLDHDWNAMARDGVVDAAFPTAAAGLRRVHLLARDDWLALPALVQEREDACHA